MGDGELDLKDKGSFAMKKSKVGLLAARLSAHTLIGRTALKWALAAEGGEMTSLTLRSLLRDKYGVTVGDYSYGSLLTPGHCDRNTEIGAYVSVGPNVRRFGAAHPITAGSLHPYFYNPRLGLVDASSDVDRTACEIGHDSWLGANTVILPTCRRIGIGAVVGAGSVVTRDVPDFAVVVGSPARVIKYRFEESERQALLNSHFWELKPLELAEFITNFHTQSNRF